MVAAHAPNAVAALSWAMCNLYRMTKGPAEVAGLFAAGTVSLDNVGSEVYPGQAGFVIARGTVRSMAWGFPMAMRGSAGQPLRPSPVNNTRADELDSLFWRSSFEERRCLIPMTAFAMAHGPIGKKTRAWLCLPGQEAFTCAGIWRDSDEWGPVYSLVMTEARVHMAAIHDRMPVILPPGDRALWTGAPTAEARALCVPWAAELAIYHTAVPRLPKG
jgi:putative SOS response-associated peptidase YedK